MVSQGLGIGLLENMEGLSVRPLQESSRLLGHATEGVMTLLVDKAMEPRHNA
jgi:hypothetical protein